MVRTVMEKSWNFKMVISRPGKVMEVCYNHIFIYVEFEIIHMFFKERRSKCKPAYALDTQHVLNCSCLYRDFSLVLEIWFKVLEIHRSKCVRTLKNSRLIGSQEFEVSGKTSVVVVAGYLFCASSLYTGPLLKSPWQKTYFFPNLNRTGTGTR